MIIALIALLVILAIVFVVLCLITGVGFGAMLGLIGRRLSPRFLDARIDVTSPDEAVQQYALTDRRRFDLGPDSAGLSALPCTLRFEPRVSIMQGSDEATVRVMKDQTGTSILLVEHAATRVEEPVFQATLVAEDKIRVEMSDGTRCELVFGSIKYMGA